MNLINKKLIKTKNINLIIDGKKLILENNSEKHGFVIIPKIYKYKKENYRILRTIPPLPLSAAWG